jgi:hypothetical protein
MAGGAFGAPGAFAPPALRGRPLSFEQEKIFFTFENELLF